MMMIVKKNITLMLREALEPINAHVPGFDFLIKTSFINYKLN